MKYLSLFLMYGTGLAALVCVLQRDWLFALGNLVMCLYWLGQINTTKE